MSMLSEGIQDLLKDFGLWQSHQHAAEVTEKIISTMGWEGVLCPAEIVDLGVGAVVVDRYGNKWEVSTGWQKGLNLRPVMSSVPLDWELAFREFGPFRAGKKTPGLTVRDVDHMAYGALIYDRHGDPWKVHRYNAGAGRIPQVFLVYGEVGDGQLLGVESTLLAWGPFTYEPTEKES